MKRITIFISEELLPNCLVFDLNKPKKNITKKDLDEQRQRNV